MARQSAIYELYYWPFLPGRGEFVRLVLEEGHLPYRDSARECETPEMALALMHEVRGGALGGLRPYAPPVLKRGDLVISQTAVICSYLGEKHGMVGSSEADILAARQLQATLCDVADEVHNTHHPLSVALTYEEQAGAAKTAARYFVRHRLGGFLEYLESVANTHSDCSLLQGGFSYVDLALFQLFEGLLFSFPAAMKALSPRAGKLQRIVTAVAGRPWIASYLGSGRRMAFNNHGVFRRYRELDVTVQ